MRFGKIDRAAVLMALRLWTARQTLVAVGVALLVAVLIGVADGAHPQSRLRARHPARVVEYPVLVVMAGAHGYVGCDLCARTGSTGGRRGERRG